MIFLIGVFIGVFFFNNLNDTQTNFIVEHIYNVVSNIKNDTPINQKQVLIDGIKNDILTVSVVWIMGSTIIGLALVYFILCFKGFCIGYTISSILFTMRKG